LKKFFSPQIVKQGLFSANYVNYNRKGTKRSFDKDHITERMGDLNRFLEAICQNENLKCSIYTLSFLKCKDSKEFSKIRKNLDRITSRISVKKFLIFL